MKYCPECNSPLKEDARFCSSCGTDTTKDPSLKTLCCSQCGEEIGISEKFCHACGAKVGSDDDIAISPEDIENFNQITQHAPNHAPIFKMCCPQCGNKNLQATTEVGGIVSGGVYGSGKYGGLSVASNDTYWICPNCGKKFRHLDGLRKEIKSCRTVATVEYVIGVIVGLFIFIVCALFSAVVAFVVGGFVIGFFCLLGFAVSKKAERLEDELSELETGMKRFQP